MIKTIIGILFFLVVVTIYLYLAVQSKKGALPVKGFPKLKSQEAASSPDGWRSGSQAAWPLFFAGALVALFHSFGIAIAGFVMPSPDGSHFVNVLLVSGVVVCVGLYFVAVSAARDSARHDKES